MIRLAYSRRQRRHETTLDNIDTLEVELGMKPARERIHRVNTPDEAAAAWKASASSKAANYSTAITS